jgi:epoxide hydrolase A/B
MSPTHRMIPVNGITMHIAEQGDGPLVLLLHGWPETWHSWREQLQPLADAGYRVVAPDQRGFGATDCPEGVDQYTVFHLVGDVVGLIGALGEREAIVVGHDWGAPVAWHTAQFRPDLVRGVVGLSVPPARRSSESPLSTARRMLGEGFYQSYFQREGVAEADLGKDVRVTFRKLFGGDGSGVAVVEEGSRFLDRAEDPRTLPDWLTEDDLDTMVEEFTRSGFTGGLNWYRNIDRNWELTAPWQDAPITPPALYLSGEQDLVRGFTDATRLPELASDLRGVVDVPDCGHWIQLQRPAEVNSALLDFFGGL